MYKIKLKICKWITNNLSSLVKITGLLVSIGVLILLCSCGDEPVLYDSTEMIGVDLAQPMTLGDGVRVSPEGDAERSPGIEDPLSLSEDEATQQAEPTELPVKQTILVHVCGAVESPGVYELDSDSRIIDAIKEAGGFATEAATDALNLAAGISDGSKIYVPTTEEMEELGLDAGEDNIQTFVEMPQAGQKGEQAAGSSSNGSSSGSGTSNASNGANSDGIININTATKDELMTLNGIGASRAEAITSYREENGPFTTIEDIMNVSGIKSGSFDKIKDKIRVN